MPSTTPRCKHEGTNVLLVEGSDDCHVVLAVCLAHNVPETFGIYECGSDDKVLKRLNALISQPDPPITIGILLDADEGVDRRWQSVRDKLRNYPYSFPEIPYNDGTIIDAENHPRLGIWLMPNNQIQGMLEDFCLMMIDKKTQEYVSKSVISAQDEKVCTFKQVHFSKAVVHTYLAWQDEPGTPLGLSITRQALKPHTEIAGTFTGWLSRLFTDNS